MTGWVCIYTMWMETVPCMAPAVPESFPVINSIVLFSYILRIYKNKCDLILVSLQKNYNATVLDIVKKKEKIGFLWPKVIISKAGEEEKKACGNLMVMALSSVPLDASTGS